MTRIASNDHKKLIYNANHRGLKEMDVLLGGYATQHLAHLSLEDQNIFEHLLAEQDADILDWCLGKETAPPHYQKLIVHLIEKT
ncbi:MAG: succinate dehydrogenase assembly factor 2 [Candidatus Paracaedibacteraceae bacterium]|nr:succinate dehydrogenase assembly factor 2 [Candidatus Paracaedibacteraceae bacterium]